MIVANASSISSRVRTPRDSIFYSQHPGCGSHLSLLDYLYRTGRIPEHGDVRDFGNHFPEQLWANTVEPSATPPLRQAWLRIFGVR